MFITLITINNWNDNNGLRGFIIWFGNFLFHFRFRGSIQINL